MIRKYSVIALLSCLIAFSGFGQETSTETQKRRGLPNIPGSFVLELGLNRTLDSPDTFDIGFWGSRSFNLYYQVDKRILGSKFSFHPGVGFAFERYKLVNSYTLALDGENAVLVPATDFVPGIKKSMLVTNYLDVLAEFRFRTNPDDPVRSFRASIGGRAGYLYDAFTKIKYKEDGETKKIKNNQNFNLNSFRYGAFVKVGAGNFTIFGYYNLSPLFKSDEGPNATEMTNMTIGISLSSF